MISAEALDYLDAPVKRVTAPDSPVPFAPVMENYYVPNSEDIVKGVKEIVG